MTSYQQIICAPATSVGSGAVSIVRVSGEGALSLVDKVVEFKRSKAAESRGYEIRYGVVPGVDDVLVSLFRGPKSYTGEDSAEISCHASAFVVGRIMELLCAAGARPAEPGEFTKRAFLNGKMDLAQAEAVADVIASSNEAAHKVALRQLRGGYSEELGRLRSQMLTLSALLELELDFSEEDVEFADRSRLSSLLEECTAKVRSLAESFRLGNAIKNGVPVAIVGAPNSGKSTILNRLVGEERAIVSDIAGTTRDTIEECVVVGGIKFRFIDTAGIRKTSDVVESMGVERSMQAIAKADVVIGVVDASLTTEELAEQGKWLVEHVDEGQKLFLVCNKIDACPGAPLPDALLKTSDAQGFALSARTGEGFERLVAALADSQKGLSAGEDQTLVTNARHHAALVQALGSLEELRRGIEDGIPTDLLAEHLRAAISDLGSITGEISTDDVLGEIFEKFCIGK